MTGISATQERRSQLVPARSLLLCGVVTGPLFIVTVFVQAFTREGFDPRRHPLSLLSLGDLGWLQVTNFVLSGLLFLAAAIGMRRVMNAGRGHKWGPRLIGAFGVCLIWAGVFVADPSDGFPPGTPDGVGQMSWHGFVHSTAPTVAFLILGVGCVVFARRFAAQRQTGWVVYCVATLAALFTPNLLMGTDWFVIGLYVTLVLGWGWASAVTAAVLAEADDTQRRPTSQP